MNSHVKIICLMLMLTLSVVSCPILALPASDRFFDQYGNICWEDEKARLDNFAISLQSDPDLIGYIIVYDGNPSCREEAIARAIRARNYVVKYRKVEWNRVVWRYGGHQEELTVVLQPIPRTAPEL